MEWKYEIAKDMDKNKRLLKTVKVFKVLSPFEILNRSKMHWNALKFHHFKLVGYAKQKQRT